MKRIYKYNITICHRLVFSMPRDAVILSFKLLHNTPYIWALVDPDQPGEDRHFTIRGTGQPFDDADQLEYIGTIIKDQFVWHLFEVK